MSTAVATPTTTPAVAAPKGKLSFPHLLRGEWIKFWSVRSTIWTMSIFLVVVISLTVLISLAYINAPSPADGGPPPEVVADPLGPFSFAVTLGQLALAVLGTLTITSEYTTGMIRSSLTAAPKRLPVLWSKALVLIFSVLVASFLAIAGGAALQALFFGGQDFSIDFSDSQTIRALGGTALYLATIGLFSFALGALLRHSAAAVATVLGLLLVAPILFQIPWKPLAYMMPFLPGVAGQQVTQTDAQLAFAAEQTDIGADLTAWQGYGVLLIWVAVILGLAAVLLKKRDA